MINVVLISYYFGFGANVARITCILFVDWWIMQWDFGGTEHKQIHYRTLLIQRHILVSRMVFSCFRSHCFGPVIASGLSSSCRRNNRGNTCRCLFYTGYCAYSRGFNRNVLLLCQENDYGTSLSFEFIFVFNFESCWKSMRQNNIFSFLCYGYSEHLHKQWTKPWHSIEKKVLFESI